MKNTKQDVPEIKTTNPHQLAVGDYASYKAADKFIQGPVTNVFEENNVTKLEIDSYFDGKQKIKANDPNLAPLFMVTKKGEKVPTRFDIREIYDMVNKKAFASLDFKTIKNEKMIAPLLKGDMTKVVSVQLKKTNEENLTEHFTVNARFQLERSKNGNAQVHSEIGHLELKYPEKINGKEFSKSELKKLKETGNLGLVDGFISTKTGEQYKSWVGVDKGLNKVVVRPDYKVYYDKIFGQTTNDAQKETLRKGEGIVLEFKNKENEIKKSYIQIHPASTRRDGIRSFDLAKAQELKLPGAIEKKNDPSITKAKGQKI